MSLAGRPWLDATSPDPPLLTLPEIVSEDHPPEDAASQEYIGSETYRKIEEMYLILKRIMSCGCALKECKELIAKLRAFNDVCYVSVERADQLKRQYSADIISLCKRISDKTKQELLTGHNLVLEAAYVFNNFVDPEDEEVIKAIDNAKTWRDVFGE